MDRPYWPGIRIRCTPVRTSRQDRQRRAMIALCVGVCQGGR